jgi:hypothetical protein
MSSPSSAAASGGGAAAALPKVLPRKTSPKAEKKCDFCQNVFKDNLFLSSCTHDHGIWTCQTHKDDARLAIYQYYDDRRVVEQTDLFRLFRCLKDLSDVPVRRSNGTTTMTTLKKSSGLEKAYVRSSGTMKGWCVLVSFVEKGVKVIRHVLIKDLPLSPEQIALIIAKLEDGRFYGTVEQSEPAPAPQPSRKKPTQMAW